MLCCGNYSNGGKSRLTFTPCNWFNEQSLLSSKVRLNKRIAQFKDVGLEELFCVRKIQNIIIKKSPAIKRTVELYAFAAACNNRLTIDLQSLKYCNEET